MTDTQAPTPDAANAATANTDMDDILSSIKNTVEEETAKAEDGVLTLDAADMVEAEDGAAAEPVQTEERIDLDAFTESGEVAVEEVDINKADILDEVVGVAANPPKPDTPEAAGDAEVENPDVPLEENPDAAEVSAETAEKLAGANKEESSEETPTESEAPAETEAADDGAVDVDAMLAAASADKAEAESEVTETSEPEPVAEEATDEVATDEVDVDALMAEAAPAKAAPEAAEGADAAADDVDIDALMAGGAEAEEAEVPEETATEAETTAEVAAPTATAASVNLPATNTTEGLQVAFPSEVLAEALRPLVKGWVDQNLQEIVEKLVKEELERLANG